MGCRNCLHSIVQAELVGGEKKWLHVDEGSLDASKRAEPACFRCPCLNAEPQICSRCGQEAAGLGLYHGVSLCSACSLPYRERVVVKSLPARALVLMAVTALAPYTVSWFVVQDWLLKERRVSLDQSTIMRRLQELVKDESSGVVHASEPGVYRFAGEVKAQARLAEWLT